MSGFLDERNSDIETLSKKARGLYNWIASLDHEGLSFDHEEALDHCREFDALLKVARAAEQLKQLAKDIQRGEAGIDWRELVAEDQRGEIAKHNWNNSMFSYGMEYGILAAAAMEEERNEYTNTESA